MLTRALETKRQRDAHLHDDHGYVQAIALLLSFQQEGASAHTRRQSYYHYYYYYYYYSSSLMSP
jgi:hypothetical protein